MRYGKEKKKMRLNPIVKKDVKVQSRSMKICFGVFAYELILALVFFLRHVSDPGEQRIFHQ